MYNENNRLYYQNSSRYYEYTIFFKTELTLFEIIFLRKESELM
jgi:hypothetical protein